MGGIDKKTQREDLFSLAAGKVYQHLFLYTKPNTFQIHNLSQTDVAFVSTKANISATFYDIIVPAGATTLYTFPAGTKDLYFLANNNVDIDLLSYVSDSIYSSDLHKTSETTIINSTTTSSVIVTGMPPLAAGTNKIGNVGIDPATPLPAGGNNIGHVTVDGLPSIPAGGNNIGKVDVNSIAAGDNNIGNVDVVTLPSIPAGGNSIGNVGLNAGGNKIGKVDIDTSTTPLNQAATTPAIFNVTCAVAGTEYSQALPANTKRFSILNQGNLSTTTWQLYFSAGAGTTMKFPGNMGYTEENILTSATLYFKSTNAGDIIQILAWS